MVTPGLPSSLISKFAKNLQWILDTHLTQESEMAAPNGFYFRQKEVSYSAHG